MYTVGITIAVEKINLFVVSNCGDKGFEDFVIS